MNETNQICVDAELSLKQNIPLSHIALIPQTATFISIIVLLVIYWRNRISIHGNLLILFSNLIAAAFFGNISSLIMALRQSFVYFTYKHPCDILTPLPIVVLFTSPSSLFSVAYPAFHFCIMAERFRATFLADKYESEGQKFGIWMAISIWLTSIAYMAFIIVAAFMDPEMRENPLRPSMLMSSSQYISQPVIYVNILVFFLILFTAYMDWRITVLNKQLCRRTKTYQRYSLSRNYQLNENALTMRLIFPLDVLYALLYSLQQMLTILLRAISIWFSPNDFIFYYGLVRLLLYVYFPITVIVYIRFVQFVSRCQKRTILESTNSTNAVDYTGIHFKQLQAQWDMNKKK